MWIENKPDIFQVTQIHRGTSKTQLKNTSRGGQERDVSYRDLTVVLRYYSRLYNIII